MTHQHNEQGVPTTLSESARWMVWDIDGAGRKPPRAARHADMPIDGSKPQHWTTFAKATEAARKNQMGIGFALGAVKDGPTFAGIDLDKCRNPDTGVIEEWAEKIVGYFDSYTEISPSGCGLKIFLLGALPNGAKQGKVYKVEIYDQDRYFTVTGHHVTGTPTTVEHRESQLRDLYARVWGRDLIELVKVFGFYVRDRGEWIDIHCPWQSRHSTPNQEGEAALHITNGKVDGFNCFHAGCRERYSLGDVYALFGLKGGNAHDFITDDNGKVVGRSQENIRRAVELLGLRLEHDVFADKIYLVKGDLRHYFDDAALDTLQFDIEETYHLCPPDDYFRRYMGVLARTNPVHPVREYLNALKWDRIERVDTWLVTYGGAKDTEYVRQVGAKTLIGAVRRIRQPGCKHDEMLLFYSPVQGLQKSSAIAMLCPNREWFSDDLPLHAETKEVIERTQGKWIIEAADLSGMRQSEIERLKAFISRQVDGPVRMAYGHNTKQRARMFILMGSTNIKKSLKDSTGNRRFWPVEVDTFDIEALRRDRDQLWAEANVRESIGESNRLDKKHWAAATQVQANSRVDDPWLDTLRDYLEGEPDSIKPLFVKHIPRDRIPLDDMWQTVGLTNIDRRDEKAAVRLEAVMQALGYEKKQMRGIGEDVKSIKRWCRRETGDTKE